MRSGPRIRCHPRPSAGTARRYVALVLVGAAGAFGGSVADLLVPGGFEDPAAESSVVAEAASYWSRGGAPPLRSTDGTKALVLVRLDGTETENLERAEGLLAAYDGPRGAVTVDVGGQVATFAEINTVIEEDLVTAEMIALPITLVLLVLVFGSVVAGLLPSGSVASRSSARSPCSGSSPP